VSLFVPTPTPLTFHWYCGDVPPFIGNALNVTNVPAHTWIFDVEMVRLTGNTGFTIMDIVFDVAGLPLAHAAFEVRIQVTKSPFAGI